MFRDLRYAWRSFRRAPLVALTIVMTVGLGLGLVTVVFTILNSVVFRVDEVRNPHQLFAVERQRSANAEPELFTRAEYDALVRETNVFADAFAMGPNIDSWIDGQRMEGALVTGNFFHALGVSAARGRTLTPADDEPGGQAIVLSYRAWSRRFASDSNVLDRTVLVNGLPFHIVGVMPEGFRGLELAPPDFWAPLAVHSRLVRRERDDALGLGIVGRLEPAVSRSQALAALQLWDARHAPDRSVEQRTANLALEPKQGTVPMSVEALALFAPHFIAFGLILLIGCANVANLLLARAVARQREIGIRLAIGASRRRVIWQLLTESLLLALVSAAVGFGVSRLVLALVVYMLTSTLPPDIGNIRLAIPPADWRVALFLVLGAMASTVFFALAPTLQATRLELVRAIRGEVLRDARPGRARGALVALQVTGSVLLLICAAVFLRSAAAAATVDPGIRTVDIVTIESVDERMRGTVLDTVRREPSVAEVAASWPASLGGRSAVAEANLARSVTSTSTVTYQFVSPEYFGVLDIDLVRGRGFTPGERSARAAVAVVSESVARQLWPDVDAVGQTMRLEPDRNDKAQDQAPQLSPSVIVVGIARDVPGFRLAGMRLSGAGVYLPIDAEASNTSLTMRVHGDPELARRALVERLTAIDPNIGQVATLRTMANTEVYFLRLAFWLTLALGGLALLLTLSGLFSVLSYLIEQRTREIGVRMALGATKRSIGTLVLSQSARPVGIGLLLGGSLTAALGAALLASPAAEQIGSTVRLFDPIAYVASLLCIVAACACAALIPALRAGRVDPVAALRQE